MGGGGGAGGGGGLPYKSDGGDLGGGGEGGELPYKSNGGDLKICSLVPHGVFESKIILLPFRVLSRKNMLTGTIL